MPKKQDEPLTFEIALARLESVVNAMEREDTTLEDSIKLYKEGTHLSKYCSEILGRLESEIVLLKEEGESPLTLC